MGTTPRNVHVAPDIISPDELDARMALFEREIDARRPDAPARPAAVGAAGARAGRLHELWWTMAPPENPRGPGLRGAVGHGVRRVTRRLTSWLFEPRLTAQREIDAEVARFASDAAAALDEAHGEIERLGRVVADLRRELAAARARDGVAEADS